MAAAFIESIEYPANIALSMRNIRFVDKTDSTMGTVILKMLFKELSIILCSTVLFRLFYKTAADILHENFSNISLRILAILRNPFPSRYNVRARLLSFALYFTRLSVKL
jgi:hypothetical protein